MKMWIGLGSAVALLLAVRTDTFGGHAALVGLFSAGFLFLIVRSFFRMHTPVGGRMMTGHGHGTNLIRTHEGGHYVAAKEMGGSVTSATVTSNGGLVRARIPNKPENAIAFWLAGQYAAGTSEGASEDNRLIRKELNRLPKDQRKAVEEKGKRMARSIVNSNGGAIKKVARRLGEKGKLTH